MEILTDEQRKIAKLEIMLDVCRRDKDALRYQLEEAKRKAAEQSAHPTAFGARLRARLANWLFDMSTYLSQSGGG